MRARGLRAAVAAPVWVDGQLWGVFLAGSTSHPFPAEAPARLGAFTELVAQAIANVDAQIRLKESRARIVEAADVARRRIERDLHDGAQQRLVALALSLRLAARSADADTAGAIERCIDDLQAALAELRELARGLHPAVLTEHGLPAALEMLATRSHVHERGGRGHDRARPPSARMTRMTRFGPWRDAIDRVEALKPRHIVDADELLQTETTAVDFLKAKIERYLVLAGWLCATQP